jgi:phosphatidylinositol alpha-1,6-mannosyltransferase
MKRKILFITRRYPPAIGGIETHCYQLYNKLIEKRAIKLVALRKKSKIHLTWFLPFSFIVGLKEIMLGKVDVIYLADGVVGFLAPFFKFFTKLNIVVTIYGLEMTYKNPVAQWLMIRGARACDKVAVISENTRNTTLGLGVDPDRIVLIYVGIQPPETQDSECKMLREEFESEHGISFGKDRVLLNFGRLIPRKGVAAFLEKGMPLLDHDIKLIIGGDGIDFQKICNIRDRDNLHDRVIILKRPSDETIAMLRRSCDLFIFPNVPFPNDIEGFGMTQLESMYSGVPVVAFAVDALVESVREGGYLIKPNDYQAFVNQIHDYFNLPQEQKDAKREEARAYVRREYSWDKNAMLYQDVFEGN